MNPLKTVDNGGVRSRRAYRAWGEIGGHAVLFAQSGRERPGFWANFLRGMSSALRIFPETRFPSAGLSRRYVFGNPWKRDWDRVGQDLFQAILKFEQMDSARASGTRSPQPNEPVPSR